MAIFLLDPTYPENEEKYADFLERLNRLVGEQFNGLEVEEIDAGPSASVPGWLIPIASLGWFLFTAPANIDENLPYWKSYFSKVIEIADELNLDFSIDLHDAACVAVMEVLENFSWEDSKIEIVSCTRHSRNLNGIWSEHLDLDGISEPKDSYEKHTEACKQLECRYIFLIRRAYECATIVIDRKGHCEFSKLL